MIQKPIYLKNELTLKSVTIPYEEKKSDSTIMNDEEGFLKRVFEENPKKVLSYSIVDIFNHSEVMP
jgi:hypothetical protein